MGYDIAPNGDGWAPSSERRRECQVGDSGRWPRLWGKAVCWVWLALTAHLRLGGLHDFAMLFCACALAIAFRRLLDRPAWFTAAAWGSAALGGIATAVLSAGAYGPTALAAQYAVSFCTSLIMLLWTHAFAQRKLYVAGLGLSVAYAGGSAIYLGLVALPDATAQGAAIVLPLLSVALLRLADTEKPATTACQPHAEAGRPPSRPSLRPSPGASWGCWPFFALLREQAACTRPQAATCAPWACRAAP